MADSPSEHHINGKVPATWDFAEFTIGGKVVKVPAFSFHMLEVLKDELHRLDNDAEMDWIERNALLFRIIAVLRNPDAGMEDILKDIQELKRVCTIPEMRELIPAYNNLLRVSGFIMGEAEAPEPGANRGTETLAASLPNSPQEESAVETSIGFDAATLSGDTSR